jgi:hypothetical protein
MDLNDLFFRQQIARSNADAARSETVRDLHEALARGYEMQIAQAARGSAARINPTLAVAMTAREVRANERS